MASSAKEILSKSRRTTYGLLRRFGSSSNNNNNNKNAHHHVRCRIQKHQPQMAKRTFSSSLSTDELPPVKHASKFKGPIVNQLWDLRLEAKQKAATQTIDMERPRPPAESMTKITYDFKDDEFLMERYRNPFGHLRFGKVLEDLDALAGNIAYSHVQDPKVNIVTASVDRIRLSGSISLEKNQALTGKVTYVGTSSMEIRMQCKSDGEDDPWMEG